MFRQFQNIVYLIEVVLAGNYKHLFEGKKKKNLQVVVICLTCISLKLTNLKELATKWIRRNLMSSFSCKSPLGPPTSIPNTSFSSCRDA